MQGKDYPDRIQGLSWFRLGYPNLITECILLFYYPSDHTLISISYHTGSGVKGSRG